jgi:hypothetical protein
LTPKGKDMTRIAALTALMLSGTPALANYGDIDAQIEAVQLAAVYVAQPQVQSTTDIAAANACTLPFTHIVNVPAQFETAEGVEVACLEE